MWPEESMSRTGAETCVTVVLAMYVFATSWRPEVLLCVVLGVLFLTRGRVQIAFGAAGA